MHSEIARGGRAALKRIPGICCWLCCARRGGPAADFLRRKRVTETALRGCVPARGGQPAPFWQRRPLAAESRKAMEFAVLGAHAASAARAGNEHLLCAMLEDTSCTASVWLAALGIEVPQAARECRQLSGQMVLPAQPRMAASRGGKPSEKYGRDLTRLAQEGRLDRCSAGTRNWTV